MLLEVLADTVLKETHDLADVIVVHARAFFASCWANAEGGHQQLRLHLSDSVQFVITF